MTKYCTSCGYKFEKWDDGKFCPLCGSNIRKRWIKRPQYPSKGLSKGSKAGILLSIVLLFVIMTAIFTDYDRKVLELAVEIIDEPSLALDIVDQVSTNIKQYTVSFLVDLETDNKASSTFDKPTHDELISFALTGINADRNKFGFDNVSLSSNRAAQIHAEDVLKHKTISHWLSNGEKPYMTYSRYGGIDSVSQNVAIQSCYGNCFGIDVYDAISSAEYAMMYDDAASNWGHKDNILESHHTHVSIGITYDDGYFAYVQNFEDVYFNGTIEYSNDIVRINGMLEDVKLISIGIYYDPIPTSKVYETYKNANSYSFGRQIAVVVEPPPPNYYYSPSSDTNIIISNRWSEHNGVLNISFDLSTISEIDGVYTIGMWVEDENESFIVTSYSIFIQ